MNTGDVFLEKKNLKILIKMYWLKISLLECCNTTKLSKEEYPGLDPPYRVHFSSYSEHSS